MDKSQLLELIDELITQYRRILELAEILLAEIKAANDKIERLKIFAEQLRVVH